jgi:hypothetical protein
MKISPYWDMTLCCLLDHLNIFKKPAACIFRAPLKIELAGFSKMLVTIYQTTECHIPEDIRCLNFFCVSLCWFLCNSILLILFIEHLITEISSIQL